MEHSASLSGAVTALRQDESKRMSDAVEKIRSEEEVATLLFNTILWWLSFLHLNAKHFVLQERLHKELTNLKELHTFEKEEAILQEQEVSAALRKELDTLKLVKQTSHCFNFNRHKILQQVVQSEREEREAERAKLLDTETKLTTAEQGKSEAISQATNFKEMLQHQFTEQLSEYKVSQ